ncbi:MAG: FAD-dependent oxidoreductase [Leptolyngbya sp.]|nr:FAD-dependent oxidoreductase [Candidatus Melainabacteria bacterium]
MRPTKFTIVDVQDVNIAHPLDAVRTFAVEVPENNLECDILIVGGGTGGVSTALSALTLANKLKAEDKSYVKPKIILTEETDWLGGQMTAQGVSALDENPLAETTGSSLSYQKFRRAIRARYKTDYKLTESANQEPWLNPGDCWVSWLAFEPKIAVEEIDRLLKPFVDSDQLQILLREKAVYVETKKDDGLTSLEFVDFINLSSGKSSRIKAKIVIDATELGDLLPLSGVEYRSGAESFATTGEAHAPMEANPGNVQDLTYPFVIELMPEGNFVIEKPAHYDEFNEQGKFSLQNYPMFKARLKGTGEELGIEKLPFWEYRRLIAAKLFDKEEKPNDLAMINWDSNDLRKQNIIDVDAQTQAERLALAKALSLGFLYWLQTEAPRDEGGKGYPEFRLDLKTLDTDDGFSKYPYIRESRRIVGLHTIVEREIVVATNSGARAQNFPDSVGIGHYPVDIHGDQDVEGAAQSTRHFQIPLGALIPRDATNLLPACKNISTTHVTNGSYRLHPIEWSIGEAQGAVAVTALKRNVTALKLAQRSDLIKEIQMRLIDSGVPVFWFDNIYTEHPNFGDIQRRAIFGLLDIDPNSLTLSTAEENLLTTLTNQI